MRHNMRAERVRNGYTAQQVADKLDVSINSVLGWERGEVELFSSNLISLARLYRCTPEYLLGLTEDRTRQAVPPTD